MTESMTPHEHHRRRLTAELTAWVGSEFPAEVWWRHRREELHDLAAEATMSRVEDELLDADTLLDLLAGLRARASDGSLQLLAPAPPPASPTRGRTLATTRGTPSPVLLVRHESEMVG